LWRRVGRTLLVTAVLTWVIPRILPFGFGAASAAQPQAGHAVIVRTDGGLGPLVDAVHRAGGRVTFEYPHLRAIAAVLPAEGLAAIARFAGNVHLVKDTLVPAPAPVGVLDARGLAEPFGNGPLDDIPTTGMLPISAISRDVTSFATRHRLAYQINHLHDEVRQLHAQGLTGEGIVIAVVDTGYRPGFGFVDDSRIVGCVSVIPVDPVGCSASANDGHGTFVAGLIAGQGIFQFDPQTSVFAHSVGAYAPGAGFDLDRDGFDESVALVGSAPEADIFMVKAFADTATATPSSVILAGIDRILEARQRGMNIRVANLSLGSFTLHPGASALDLAAEALLEAGIIPVASVGNTGPAILTAASPSSSRATIAVGAGSAAHQERIAADVGFFMAPGFGEFLRVADGAQTAWFSARGPHANGEGAPDVVADGWVVGVGLGSEPELVSIGSGTSFSAPAVAGIAGLLAEAESRGRFGPLSRPAMRIRDAIAGSGKADIIADGSTAIDQGTGWVGAWRAYRRLANPAREGKPGRGDRWPRTGSVARAVREAGLKVERAVVRNREVILDPGQRNDLVYEVRPNVRSVHFRVTDVRTAPRCAPNPVFGEDEIRLAIHGARTSAFPPAGYYIDINPGAPLHGFVSPNDPGNPAAPGMPPGACGDGSCRITITDPEPGFIRFSLNGATENACTIRARVDIHAEHAPPPKRYDAGRIGNGEWSLGYAVIPPEVTKLTFRLSWKGNWSRFPANDLDLFVLDPQGVLRGDGATLDSPEVISIENPAPGFWSYAILGFEVNDSPDHWEIAIEADGKDLKPSMR
jgi:hypothetical protein